MPESPSSAKRFLPQVVVATFAVVVLPALAVSFIETSGRPWVILSLVLLAMALSVAAAGVGSAIWTRRRGSKDIVFGDLMVWGWLRRLHAERRLADAEALLASTSGAGARELSRDRRRKLLQQLAAMLEAKDPYTLGHSRRVTRHAERIARELRLPREDVARIRIAASLHDIGKVRTPRRILTKPGGLTGDELVIVKRHPVDGALLVAELGDPAITAMVRHHHERIDGGGYPEGLSGEEIPLGARVISVADTFDAITSDRAYHDSCKHRRALDVLAVEAGSQLDPDAVSAFLSYYSGRTAVAWSAFGLTAPPRFVGSIGGMLNSVGGWAAPLSQSVAAIVAAALAGASLAGKAAPATAASEPASPEAEPASQPAGEVRDRPGRPGQRSTERAIGRSPAPVSDPRRRRSPQNEPTDGPLGGATPPSGSGTSPTDLSPPPVPGVEVPGVEVPGVELPGVELPGVELPGAQVPRIELPDADLSGLQLTDD